ncbi:MAG: alpha-galactosidase [Ornithinimicrobium sp.]
MTDLDERGWRSDGLEVLRGGGSSVILLRRPSGLPEIVHWGADLGDLDDEARSADMLLASVPASPQSGLDEAWPLTLLPSETDGWSGRPAIDAHREGRTTIPNLAGVTIRRGPSPDGESPAEGASPADDTSPAEGSRLDAGLGGAEVTVRASDPAAEIQWQATLRLDLHGVLTVRHTIVNTGVQVLSVAGMLAIMPLPSTAGEVLDLTGRWCRERHPQRAPLQHGGRIRESRRGRTGHDATLLMMAGEPGFSFSKGEVCGVHVAWSGDHVHLVDQLPEGAARHTGIIAGGELLRAGEIRLEQGEAYTTPPVLFVRSMGGLNELSQVLHGHVRGRESHPKTPRPVTVNSWEALYFDHNPERVNALVDTAAMIGAERFVLDDGWFTGRRDDSRGLGDWQVDRSVWPDGLEPLAERVREHGMQMGLWVEPEMVNIDSDVARAHPDWLLAPDRAGQGTRAWRRQQVFNLTHDGAFEHVLTHLDRVVSEVGIDYLKWDHNRDLHEAVDARGHAAVHGQTHAAYALMAALQERHPGLEIESCASGGARVDLGVLEHSQRVWPSDCNDPLERATIQRWTGVLLPPELQGTHVGPDKAHTTGRVTDLDFRCLIALFGHAGIEWDISALEPGELDRVAGWVRLHQRLRDVLHGGRTFNTTERDGAWLQGVVSLDQHKAVFAYLRLTTGAQARPGMLRIPGLDAQTRYEVRAISPTGEDTVTLHGHPMTQPPWCSQSVVLTGHVLEEYGLAMPVLNPAAGMLIEITAR